MEATKRFNRLQIRLASCAVCLAALTAACAEARAGIYSGLVVFGDSLSDSGNTYAAAGLPSAPYIDGRYTNGPVWVDYLAAKLGIAAPTPSFLGGTNHAWGFAQSGDVFTYPFGPDGPGVPNLLTQVGGFLQAGGSLTDGDLVTVWAGANDFMNGSVTDYEKVAGNIATAITALAAAGGSHFLVGNLPLLGLLPAFAALPPEFRQQFNQLTTLFNAALADKVEALRSALPGVDIFYSDVNAEFQQILADPAAYGLTNVTNSALDDQNYSGAGYLFWDTVHPTTVVHRLIADRAFAAAVPEPSSLFMATVAGATVLGVVRRRRAA